MTSNGTHKVVFSTAPKANLKSFFTDDRMESTDSLETRKTAMDSFDIAKPVSDRIFTKRDFILFSVAFALAEAPVVATLTFAPILLPNVATGGWGNGIFYLCFAMCSVTAAKSIVLTSGCKTALIYGYFGTALYVYGWGILLALCPSLMFVFFPIASAIGGVSQAVMCTAQGLYFSMASHIVMVSMNTEEVQKTHRRLANVFSFFQLLSLVIAFGICTVAFSLHWNTSSALLYLILPIFCVKFITNTILLLRINDLGDRGSSSRSTLVLRRGVVDMIMIYKDYSALRKTKLFLLLPYHICWGLCSSFWIYVVLGHFIGDKGGHVTVGIAATCQLVITFLCTIIDKYNKHRYAQYVMIVLGGCCCFAMGYLVISNATASAAFMAVIFALLYGIGRSVCDNNMMTLIADFFPLAEATAYSMVGFAKTVSAGFSFIAFAASENMYLQFDILAGIVMAVAVMGIVGFVFSSRIDMKEKSVGNETLSSRLASSSERSDRSHTISSDTIMFVPEYY